MPQTKHFIKSIYLSNNSSLNVWYVPSDTSLNIQLYKYLSYQACSLATSSGLSSSTDSFTHNRYFGP